MILKSLLGFHDHNVGLPIHRTVDIQYSAGVVVEVRLVNCRRSRIYNIESFGNLKAIPISQSSPVDQELLRRAAKSIGPCMWDSGNMRAYDPISFSNFKL
jgi:hypothetical protein